VAMNSHNRLFESDIKPLNKTLAKHYLGCEPPKLHTAFFDLEVSFLKFQYDEGYKVKVRKKNI